MNEDRADLIEKVDMNNERFSSYYKTQKIVPEDEWELLLDSLRQPLPTTFRVAGSRQTATTLNATIKDHHVPSLSDVTFEGQRISPPAQIPWYPDGLAWQFNVSKKALRKSPEFKKFHSFLVYETEVGNISRQEGVSMLPPLFLEVEPHHKVMDMCAAPGSKTAQLLEALHANDTITSTSIPPGLVLANDSDNKRTHLLIHQSARLPSPALMVTNLDASNYPGIQIPVVTQDGGTQMDQLMFDRILCDVPCSGDGTMRKNMGIWKGWSTMDGNGLHSLQVRILQRAMNLLAKDGRIVYSTCSLNPVENEAVVAEALNNNHDFELVDVTPKLPSLKRRPGLTSWIPTVIIDKVNKIDMPFPTYEQFKTSDSDQTLKDKMSKGCWPPENVDKLNLTRCLRIYPHLQDSGGFFVAVLEKKGKAPASSLISERKREANEPEDVPEAKKPRLVDYEPDETAMEEDTEVTLDESKAESADASTENPHSEGNMKPTPKTLTKKGKSKSAQGGGSFKENPYTFLSPDDLILLSCMKRLNLNSDFPASNVLVRNPAGDAVRSLYLVNDLVKTIIQHNDYDRLRLNAAGTKVLSKQEAGKGAEAQFRVLGEGLPVILPYVDPATILTGDMESLKTLIESYYPLCTTFNEPFRGIAEAGTSGSHIVRFPPGQLGAASLNHELVLPVWKAKSSIGLMIDKKAKSALSLRLYGEDLTTAGNLKNAEKQKNGTPLVEANEAPEG